MQKLASKVLSLCLFECGQEQHEHLCPISVWTELLQFVQLTDIMALTVKIASV